MNDRESIELCCVAGQESHALNKQVAIFIQLDRADAGCRTQSGAGFLLNPKYSCFLTTTFVKPNSQVSQLTCAFLNKRLYFC